MSIANQISAQTYTCPMHPDIHKDVPGVCPRCGMQLVAQPDDHHRETLPTHHETGGEDHTRMIVKMRAEWLWTNFAVMTLGLWLISSPFTFGYPTRLTIWSDVVSGALLFVFSGAALFPKWDFIGRWSVALVISDARMENG